MILPSLHDVRDNLASAHRRIDANNHSQAPWHEKPNDKPKNLVNINGKRYVRVENHDMYYKVVYNDKERGAIASLINRGANGGLARKDAVRLLAKCTHTAVASGINNHTISGLPIATVAGGCGITTRAQMLDHASICIPWKRKDKPL